VTSDESDPGRYSILLQRGALDVRDTPSVPMYMIFLV
jgi:hypothetical protein